MATQPSPVLGSGYIFLSHAGAETHGARELAEILRRNGFKVWFDKDDLAPGDAWTIALEEAIANASAMIVYVGSLGIHAWVDREVRYGLVRNTHSPHSFRFIPVLGEGADAAKLPPFVQQHQWADLRDRNRAPEQIRRLVQSLRSSSSSGTAIPTVYWQTHSPFRSLQSFRPEDSWLFFGRDQVTGELLNRLGRAAVTVVIGNSGSGKSSLVQAGLIPALRRGRFKHGGRTVDSWRIATFRPSADPFHYLAETLAPQLTPELHFGTMKASIAEAKRDLAAGGESLRNEITALIGAVGQIGVSPHILLVADQFEEVFTLIRERELRDKYIDSLLTAARLDTALPIHLILVLRADFYAPCLDNSKLSRFLDTSLYIVPQMSREQLREAIENRLALAGAHSEPGLLDSLLADVGEEPGNLALLEHSLTQLWEKSGGAGHTLTNDDYTRIGRVRGALGRHADEVYRDLDSEPREDGLTDQELAKRIFLELVQLGEGAQDTRRQIAKTDLLDLGSPQHVERVIARLASKRLVTTGGPPSDAVPGQFVEVSHEALIREWPSLRAWLEESREDLRRGQTLLQATREWARLRKDESALLRGNPLELAREWLTRNPSPRPLVAEFVEASCLAEDQSARQKREAQEREIAQAQELRREAEQRAQAERSSARRTKLFSYLLSCLLLAAVGLALTAWNQQTLAESREIAANSETLASSNLKGQALNTALLAFSRRDTTEARVAIARAFPQVLTDLTTKKLNVREVTFSPDGRRLVTSGDGNAALVWDAERGAPLFELEGQADARGVAFSSTDGRLVSYGGSLAIVYTGTGSLVSRLKGHRDMIDSAALSPDGLRVVTTSLDGTARLWNSSDGKLLKACSLSTRNGQHDRAIFSPNGQRVLVTKKQFSSVVMLNAGNGDLIAELYPCDTEPTFSPDGERVTAGSHDNKARIWDTSHGRILKTIDGHSEAVESSVFSPNGKYLLTASADGTARVWDANSGRKLAKLDDNMGLVFHADFSSDGTRVLTQSDASPAWSFVPPNIEVRVWDWPRARVLENLGKNYSTAVFSLQGRLLLTTNDGDHTATVRSGTDGQMIAELALSEGSHAVLSPDGRRAATTNDGAISRLWSVTASGRMLAQMKGHTGALWTAAFSPDGRTVVTGSEDHTAGVWDASTGALLRRLYGHKDIVRSVAFSPDGHRIITGSDDSTARVWDARSGRLVNILKGHRKAVTAAQFSPDGRRIATASLDGSALIWDAASGIPLLNLKGHDGGLWDVGFSPNGKRAVTASEDNTARIWDTTSGVSLAELKGHTGTVKMAAFSWDGKRVVTASDDNTARIWEANSGRLLAQLMGHSNAVNTAAFSRDGRRVVTASSDHSARVWDATSGIPLAKLEGLTGEVRMAAFFADDQRLLTASEDGTAAIFRVVSFEEISKLLEKK